jgi:hypothetical protein
MFPLLLQELPYFAETRKLPLVPLAETFFKKKEPLLDVLKF